MARWPLIPASSSPYTRICWPRGPDSANPLSTRWKRRASLQPVRFPISLPAAPITTWPISIRTWKKKKKEKNGQDSTGILFACFSSSLSKHTYYSSFPFVSISSAFFYKFVIINLNKKEFSKQYDRFFTGDNGRWSRNEVKKRRLVVE